MTITTEQIRNIQGGLGAQRPSWDRSEPGVTPAAGAAGVPIYAPNSEPSGASAGSPLAVSTGESGVYTTLLVDIPGTLTSVDLRWWGYYDGIAKWGLLDGSERTITTRWTQLIPSGPISRLYCEVTALTGAGAVTPYMGPSDVGGA
jgi:hypothetical protein